MPREKGERRAAPAVERPAKDWRSYDRIASTYERVRAPLHAVPARDLVSAVDPPRGGRVLDVGTGTGVAALAAAEAVGSDGMVVGVDPSLEMLRFASGKGLGHVVAGEAIDLPFRDGAFDAVVANFVIFFFTRYETALFDILRTLRHGGRMGVTTWGGGEDEFGRAWRDVAESFVGKEMIRDAVRRGAPWEERFSDPSRLKDTLWQAGLRNVRVEEREYRFTMSIDDYLAGKGVSATGRFMREMLGESSWDRFRSRVDDVFRERFRDPIGDTQDVLLATGTKE